MQCTEPSGYTCSISGSTLSCAPIPSSQTQTTPAHTIGYTPLEPLPGLANGATLDFPTFLGQVFKLLITAGALFAVILLVVSGITYIVAGSSEAIGEARRRMMAALYGFLILVGAWIMLYTVNPTLLNFNLSSIGAGNTSSTAGTAQTAPSNTTLPNAATEQQTINTCTGHLAPGDICE